MGKLTINFTLLISIKALIAITIFTIIVATTLSVKNFDTIYREIIIKNVFIKRL